MIPKNITRAHVIDAIKEILRKGTPQRRQSKDFLLEFEGKSFPPKYVISVANKYANGKELDPSVFSGGKESNGFLTNLGFEISCNTIEAPELPPVKAESGIHSLMSPRILRHNERCPVCKETIRKLLERIYGDVCTAYSLGLGTLPGEFTNSPLHDDLEEIYQSLQKFRGYNNFVHARALPPVDYYIPSQKFIVEFDESQHFTVCRKMALAKYPLRLQLGFNGLRWMELCDKIHAQDNDPPYRDEQRAWYDTLRDFLPEIMGLSSTVRLYAKEMQWCSLDPEDASDIKSFQNYIESRRTGVEGDFVATVILRSNGTVKQEEREEALPEIIGKIADVTDSDGVVLFPGGYFSAGPQEARTIFETIEKEVSQELKKIRQNIVVCLGVDGRVAKGDNYEYAKDQIVLAVDKEGITAIGRKFHAAPGERGHVELAPKPLADEEGYPRIFSLNGRRYFLAACYDTFGIRKRPLRNPGVEAILDCVHGFQPKGKAGSGEFYFARDGFARASREWKCPVFGAVVFFNRSIPENWPSCVYFGQGNIAPNKWSYAHNQVRKARTISHTIPEGIALVRLYNLVECFTMLY